MFSKLLKVSLVTVATGLAGSALAQNEVQASNTGTSSSVFGQDKFSAELKPLPTILSVIPGVAGAGMNPLARLMAARGHQVLVDALAEWFGIPYPYEKLDIVAVPVKYSLISSDERPTPSKICAPQ